MEPPPFSSFSLAPNPNPNPNPPTSDVPTMISFLNDLATAAETTLQSAAAADFLPAATSSRCPFDSRHLMAAEYLFHHSLRCPSAPLIDDLSFLQTLHYPSSLKSESELLEENRFLRPLTDPNVELCFSIDAELGHLGSNFFYRDCPSVVVIASPEPDQSSKTFTLPGFLSAECANFISDNNSQTTLARNPVLLPSDLWLLRCEAEAWRDYPESYSYTALWVALRLHLLPGVKEISLIKKWVISNSPRYGVLLDPAMRDHIFLLLKLCLSAIGREARRTSLELLVKDDELLDPRSVAFECPRLVGSLTWLAYQLSVLYGEANGKVFVMGMFKESILRVGASLLPNKLGQVDLESIRDSQNDKLSENTCVGQIFVSQVAAAVAAVRERFLLEERIRVLRFAQPLSTYHRSCEYSNVSRRGCEERKKRSNYRPLLEHDGLQWQRVQNQDQGKAKTKEELLAEERDYKRRRMTYRGKKVKRTPTEVIRDIIDDHMEEIKLAGGIGCNLKFAEDTIAFPLEYSSSHVKHEDVSRGDTLSGTCEMPKCHQNLMYEHTDHQETHRRGKHDNPISHRSYAETGEQYAEEHKTKYGKSDSQSKYYVNRSSLTPKFAKEEDDFISGTRSYAESGEQYAEEHKTKYGKTDSQSKYYVNRSRLTPKFVKEEDDFLSGTRSRDKGRSRTLDSVTQNAFGDRYDPSVSYDSYGVTHDDVSVGSSYLKSSNFNTSNGGRYDDGSKNRYHDHKT